MVAPADLRLGALGLLAVVLAAFGGWSRPAPQPGVGQAARAAAWAPIDWKPSDGTADARLLAQRNTWGWSTGGPGAAPGAPGQAAAASAPTPAQTGPWRVVGTAEWDGNTLAAIVQIQPPGAPRPQYLFRRAGESLPDGRVVTRVEPAKVEVRRPGEAAEKSEILLFRPRP